MFKRKLKIKQIAMAGSGDYIFTFGLGNDNQIYSWDVGACKWRLHHVIPAEAPNAQA